MDPWETIWTIEEHQCKTCEFSKLYDHDTARDHAEEFPMCFEVEGALMLDDDMEAPVKMFKGEPVCTKYKSYQEPPEVTVDNNHTLW